MRDTETIQYVENLLPTLSEDYFDTLRKEVRESASTWYFGPGHPEGGGELYVFTLGALQVAIGVLEKEGFLTLTDKAKKNLSGLIAPDEAEAEVEDEGEPAAYGQNILPFPGTPEVG